MSSPLADQYCVPCKVGGSPLTPEQIAIKSKELDSPDWQVLDNKKLTRTFEFDNFAQALEFTNQVGRIAEDQGHHPEIHLENFKQVRVEWWTHKINGLHANDFIMAARTDQLIQN
jgi:4a-hydroxytetrahydrobiopterin dehydratase